MPSLMVRPTVAKPGAPRRPFESTGTAMSLRPPWADAVAALTRVVQRQAAMIFRRERSDVDVTDPALEAVRDRSARVRHSPTLSGATWAPTSTTSAFAQGPTGLVPFGSYLDRSPEARTCLACVQLGVMLALRGLPSARSTTPFVRRRCARQQVR